MVVKTIYKKDLSQHFLDKLSKYLENGFIIDTAQLWLLRFSFWWQANPNVGDATPVAWIVENETTGNITGFLGNLPALFDYKGIKLITSSACAWYVSDETSADAAALYLQFNRQKNLDFFLNTTPSPSVQKMLQGTGYKMMGLDLYLRNYMIMIKTAPFISMMSCLLDKFSESKNENTKYLMRVCSKLGNKIAEIIPKSNPKILPPCLDNYIHEIRICPDSSAFMQYLHLHKKGDTIELSKDKTTLDWILFSPEVQALLHRTTAQIFTKAGEYCGYFIYDIQHVGKDTTLRIREIQLLKPDDAVIKLILRHAKIEANNAGCAAVYSGLQNPDPEVDKLLHKHILLSLKTDNRYYVKFRKNVITDVDPYAIYVPSDLDPDVGFI